MPALANLKELAGNIQMPDIPDMSGLVSTMQDYVTQNPRLGKMLMAGLGSAAAGGGLTAMSKRENESREERRKRILRNALGAGAAGAGIAGLGDFALGELSTVDPEVEDPVLNPLKNIAGIVGGGAGVLGTRAVGKNDMARSRNIALTAMKDELNKPDFKPVKGDKGLFKKVKAPPVVNAEADRTFKRILQGISDPSESKQKGFINRVLHGGADEGIFNDLQRAGKGGLFDELAAKSNLTPENLRDAGRVQPFQRGAGNILETLKQLVVREGRKTFGNTAGKVLGRTGTIGASAAIPYLALNMLEGDRNIADNTLGRFDNLNE